MNKCREARRERERAKKKCIFNGSGIRKFRIETVRRGLRATIYASKKETTTTSKHLGPTTDERKKKHVKRPLRDGTHVLHIAPKNDH